MQPFGRLSWPNLSTSARAGLTVWSGMLQVVAEPARIDRAIKRLHGALQGVPARGVRLTWRGGELRTTIHWAVDDGFWWAVEPRHARDALVLGHAPEAPGKRESITGEIILPRQGADRKVARVTWPTPAASAKRASATFWPMACGGTCAGPTARRPRR